MPAPSSLTIRSGYVALENLIADTHPVSIYASSSWDLGKQTAFWSSVGYVQERTMRYYDEPLRAYDGFTGAPVRTHLVPVSAGFRAYANDRFHHSRGLFVEAGPSLGGALYRDLDGVTHPAALGGVQCGMGVRFAPLDGSRFELGGSYQMLEGIGGYSRSLGRLGANGIDYHLFSLYLGVGFGN
jgi:hypothetical protein